MDKNLFDPVDEEVEAQRMQYVPFDRIAEIERMNQEGWERRARLRELTTEKPVQELTPREAADLKMERVRQLLSNTAPGSPGAASASLVCLRDLADAVAYLLEKDAAQV